MKLHYLIFTSLLLILAIFSCKKSELETNQNISGTITPVEINAYVEDGALHFADAESFFKALDIANATNEESLDAWEASKGFESAGFILNEVMSALENQSTEGLEQEYLTKYPNLFVNSSEQGLDVKVAAISVLRLINQDRIVFIGKGLYKFTEDGQYLVSNGDKSLLPEIETTRESVVGKYYFFGNTASAAVDRACGYIIPAQILMNANENRQSDFRHFWLNIPVETSSGIWTVQNRLTVQGVAKKKNFFGNWVWYKTNHELEWDLEMDIVNENSLMFNPQGFPTGVVIDYFFKIHKGSRTDQNVEDSSYYTSYFQAKNIPYTFLQYADPIWKRINLDRHRTQGITPAWNSFTCQ